MTPFTPGDAAGVLYRHRHAQAPDIIRSLQSIRPCVPAARHGAPRGPAEDDPAAYREHKLAACEAEAAECTHDEHEQPGHGSGCMRLRPHHPDTVQLVRRRLCPAPDRDRRADLQRVPTGGTMRCHGLHCPGCGHGGGGWLAALVVAILVIGAIIAQPVAHAADDAIHVAAEVLKITAIVLASAAGAAVLGALAILGARVRHHLPARPREAAVIHLPAGQPAVNAAARELPASPGRELPAPQVHLHFHGVTAEDVAAIAARHGEDDQPWP